MKKNLKKKQVNLRLYEEDLRRIKRQAAVVDVPWQPYFRNWVHRQLEKKKGKLA